ncbi:MAG: DNRLRE domain-containing protein, partial [Holophagales bacterium]|nr:DNRLRE domain-containing protein [Holophagales bacterium]
AVADAFVSQTAPTINYGGLGQLSVRAATTGQGLSTYMKFQVSGIQGTLVSVKLRMRPVGWVGPTRLYKMVSTSWNESHITWQNAPLDFYFQRLSNATSSGGWLEMDVSDMVGSNGLYTLGMTAEDAPGQAFHSRESGSAPVLVVTYQL